MKTGQEKDERKRLLVSKNTEYFILCSFFVIDVWEKRKAARALNNQGPKKKKRAGENPAGEALVEEEDEHGTFSAHKNPQSRSMRTRQATLVRSDVSTHTATHTHTRHLTQTHKQSHTHTHTHTQTATEAVGGELLRGMYFHHTQSTRTHTHTF